MLVLAEPTFVLHAPFQLDNDLLTCQVVQEWLGIYRYILQEIQIQKRVVLTQQICFPAGR